MTSADQLWQLKREHAAVEETLRTRWTLATPTIPELWVVTTTGEIRGQVRALSHKSLSPARPARSVPPRGTDFFEQCPCSSESVAGAFHTCTSSFCIVLRLLGNEAFRHSKFFSQRRFGVQRTHLL